MRKFVVVFVTACLVPACMAGDAPPPGGGDDGGGDDGGGDGFGPADFITEFAAEECGMAHSCKASFPTDEGVTFDEAFGATVTACEAMAADYYQPEEVRAAVMAGRIVYDRAAAESCLQGLDWGTCTQYWDGDSPVPAACGEALVGTIADGGACTIDLECAMLTSWCGDAGACEPIPDDA